MKRDIEQIWLALIIIQFALIITSWMGGNRINRLEARITALEARK